MPRDRLLKLAVAGTAAGLFSGLFGVGGGTIIVPLLILWFGYGEREATGTSLAAIAIIGAVGAAVQGAYGNVDVERALQIGVPATVGVVLGTTFQQRVPTKWISLLFAGLLVVVAIDIAIP